MWNMSYQLFFLLFLFCYYFKDHIYIHIFNNIGWLYVFKVCYSKLHPVTDSDLSIKSFAYHVTTLENFKKLTGIWHSASGTRHLASGNWQAATDGKRNCLIYILSSHYGAQQNWNKAWGRIGFYSGGGGGGDHVRGAFQFTRSLSALQRERERGRDPV